MKDVIQIVVVDPCEESRTSLKRVLGGITSIWLAQVLSSYEEAMTRAEELAAQITIVVLDHNVNQAVDLIQETQPRDRRRDRGARELLLR